MLALPLTVALLGFYSPPTDITDPDFIIAGAGAGGCVAANRFALAGYKTVLLEEGPEDTEVHESPIGEIDPYSLVPSLNVFFQFAAEDITRNMWSESATWEYDREANSTGPIPEKHLFMLELLGQLPENWRRRSFEHTAKIVGGNTMHNYQIWIRPGGRAEEEWGSNWDAEGLGRILLDIEENWLKLPPYPFNSTFLAQAQFQQDVTPETPLLEAAIKGGWTPIELGRNVALYNFSGGTLATTEYTRNNAWTERVSAARAFLTKEIRDLPTLNVRAHSKVLKILFDENKVATGVLYRDHRGREKRIYAKKEVILSMGSLASPQFMMLSGVGPKEHLEEMGIEVVHDSPGVGQNLENHILAPVFIAKKGSSPDQSCAGGCAGAIVGHAFSSLQDKSTDDQDMQFISIAYTDQPDYNRIIFEYYFSRQHRVKSRGQIRLRSTDPDDFPIIDPKYFEGEGEEDVQVIMESIQYFKDTVMANAPEDFSVVAPGDDVDLEWWVKRYSGSYWHWTGTLRIGGDDDPEAVVDQSLLVRGVKNLRVLDASVMPHVPNANTQAASMAVGYRGAEIAIEEHKAAEAAAARARR